MMVTLCRFLPLAVVALAAFGTSGPVAAGIVLVESGQPKATIVVAEDASGQAKEAARVLQEYLQIISGARLEIKDERAAVAGSRILVGRSKAVADLGVLVPSGSTYQMDEEGFVSKTVGGELILAGNEDWQYRGTLYAVYDLLEEIGCRWFFPGAFGQVVPHRQTIRVADRDRVERPSFRFRNIWCAGGFPLSQADAAQYKVWLGRNKMAGYSISFPSDGSISKLAPAAKYFESQPHIFALDKDGRRRKEMLCMSEPDSVRIAVQTVTDYFRQNPQAYTFGFAPADGFPMCYCQRCQNALAGFSGKGYGDPSLSEVWFSFVNKVAKEVYKEFPQRWLLTNGYANRVRPPEGIGPLSPNLGIQSAVLPACSLHRIGDPKCWQRILYRQLIDRWTDALDCVFIYDYDPGVSLVNMPFPALHNLRHDMPYFKQRGVWRFWTEGSNTWLVTHLNYYVRGKLMWDTSENVEALVRD